MARRRRAEGSRHEHRCRHSASGLAPRGRCRAAPGTRMTIDRGVCSRQNQEPGAELHVCRVRVARHVPRARRIFPKSSTDRRPDHLWTQRQDLSAVRQLRPPCVGAQQCQGPGEVPARHARFAAELLGCTDLRCSQVQHLHKHTGNMCDVTTHGIRGFQLGARMLCNKW